MMQVLEAAPPPRTSARSLRLSRSLAVELALVLAGVAIALLVSSHLRNTVYNNYVRMADAWLHGHLWIEWPGPAIDAVEWNGKHYGIDGPFPVLFVLPFAAIWGLNANETLVSMFVCLVDVALAWLLLLRLGVVRNSRLWLILFFFAGTDLWWCSELGDVWFLAHLCAIGCTFGAVLELTGKRRGWLVALLAFCAYESRAPMLFAVPLYLFLLVFDDLVREVPGWTAPASRDLKATLISFFDVCATCVMLWITYNFMLWGTWNDIGHWLYYHHDSWGRPDGSPFRIEHFPYQFYSFFMRAPQLAEYLQQAQWPIFKFDTAGVSLPYTSPALVLAFLADRRKRLTWALWITVALVAAPDFLYYLDGWVQFGMRHALDFEPFLLLLMALGTRERMPRWGAILIGYSALFGLYGVVYWNAFMRPGN